MLPGIVHDMSHDAGTTFLFSMNRSFANGIAVTVPPLLSRGSERNRAPSDGFQYSAQEPFS